MIIYVRAKIDNQAENITAKRQERQEPTHPPGVSKDKNSYPDFFGIMTFYQECCICAIFSTKSQDNMDDFSLTYKFF